MTRPRLHDDWAYIVPMLVFLGLTELSKHWSWGHPVFYAVKTVVAASLLIVLWPRYTRIEWRHLALGAAFGCVGVVQWVGTESLLLRYWPNYPRFGNAPFDPTQEIHNASLQVSFIAIRVIGATLVVPVMEELFWRDFLWRTILAPKNFKLAAVGERSWQVCLLVAVAFASVHVQWITATVWGMMIGMLLMHTRSLGACIVMHAITNLLLAIYVLQTGNWYFW